MQISFLAIYDNKYSKNTASKVSYPNLAPLKQDTVSFGALKKSQFEGLDLAAVEKFKAPIEQFKTNEDLQKWCKAKVKNDIVDKDFGGRQEETKIQRKAMLKEWTDYVLKENDAYNNAAALVILSSVTRELRPDNDKLPPVLNKGVLADCMSEIDSNLKKDKKYAFDLNKMYQNKLQAFYLQDFDTGEKSTKWVVIPSKENDPENFTENVDKLKTLSHKNWCTKSFNAEPYLSEGDFHVYLEDGKPKVGIRFVEDRIQEIQGEANNSKIPLEYFDEVNRHIDENKLKLTYNTEEQIKSTQSIKAKCDKIKNELKEAINNKDAKAIFEYFYFKVKEDINGYITISEYRQPSEAFTFKDCGVDENILFEAGKVKSIEGAADFRNSQVTNLDGLESIGGDADFRNSNVTDLGNLKSIGGGAFFKNSQVTNLDRLESIGKNAYFKDSKVTDLGSLKSIGWNAEFSNSQVTSLKKLESIGADADFRNSNVIDLGNLKSIGEYAHFENSNVTDLGNLKSIGWNADFSNSQVTNLDKLESIGGYANFKNSKVTDLGNLKSIGWNADFSNSQVTNLDKLESIDGYAHFENSKVTNLSNLKSIGGDAYITKSQEEYLGATLRKLTNLRVS